MSAVSTFLKQASTPWRPHSGLQNVFWKTVSGPQPLSYSASAVWLERSSFQSAAGSFSIRIVKYWNSLPTPIVTTPYINFFKRQLDSDLFAEVP